MLRTCALILPALIPSWRFFETVEASPRVEWALIATANATPERWHPFRPRATEVGPWQMLTRLFWNPEGNEALYIVSCAERIAISNCSHAEEQINARILRDISELPLNTTAKLLQFRLLFVARGANGLCEETAFHSTPVPTRK